MKTFLLFSDQILGRGKSLWGSAPRGGKPDYEEIFADYKLKWSHMVYFQTKKVLDRVIHQERNVSLHFDISDIVNNSIEGLLN